MSEHKPTYPPVTVAAQKLAIQSDAVRSETLIRLAVISAIGLVVLTLAVGMVIVVTCKTATDFTTYAAVVGPIISGVLLGLTGFIAGRQLGNSRK